MLGESNSSPFNLSVVTQCNASFFDWGDRQSNQICYANSARHVQGVSKNLFDVWLSIKK